MKTSCACECMYLFTFCPLVCEKYKATYLSWEIETKTEIVTELQRQTKTKRKAPYIPLDSTADLVKMHVQYLLKSFHCTGFLIMLVQGHQNYL